MARLKTSSTSSLPRYAAEGKSYLTVTIGCTGGKHRSVALAEDLQAPSVAQRRARHRDASRPRGE